MIIVFWRQGVVNSEGVVTGSVAQLNEFNDDELGKAMQLCEGLRASRRAGAFISHVCIQSELPESVGQAGVADIDPNSGYDWFKRRIDPSIKLGRT